VIEPLEFETGLGDGIEIALHLLVRRGTAIDFQPAVLAQIFFGAGLLQQLFVLGERVGKERAHAIGEFIHVLGAPGAPISEQPGQHPRQMRQMIIGFGRLFQRDAQKRPGIGWKRIREIGVALDDPAVAEGRALADAAALDQGHREPALGEMQSGRRADDPAAKYDDIRPSHEGAFLWCGGSEIPFSLTAGPSREFLNQTTPEL
jgi:hypothetical protein